MFLWFLNILGETNYPCDCGEVFRSKIALARHQTYACTHSNNVQNTPQKMSMDRNSEDESLDYKRFVLINWSVSSRAYSIEY